MKNSFIKKVECPNELKEILLHLFSKNKSYIENDLHFLPLDEDLTISSICHESLLKASMSAWAFFNGVEWDSIFIGCINKSEKVNKKIYSEYLHLANSPIGIKLIKLAMQYAKSKNCDYFYLSIPQKDKNYLKIKKILQKANFKNDLESFFIEL
jgi:hypothetical protein